MYDAFYGFRERPFSLLPDPDYLYLSPQHEKALGLLELSLHNQAGFCVISGEIGAGKTTLVRKLLTLAGPEFRVGLVSNTLDSFGELMNWILLAYGLPGGGSSVEQHERFLDFIIQQYGRGRRTVLIIDEAQNLGVDALEELRMLSNVNADKHQVLQVILVGQMGLRETLKRPELAQFAQRILLDFHLGPLGREDTALYIRHRILVAGADPQFFSEAAAAAVFRYSGGVPRIINLLCDTALVYGYAEGSQHISADLIHTVARERQSSSAAPALRLAAVAPPPVAPLPPVPALSAVPPLAVAQPVEPAAVPDPVADAGPMAAAREVADAASPPQEAAAATPEAEPARDSQVKVEVAAALPVTAEPSVAPAVATEDVAPAQEGAAQGDAEWLRQLADSAVPAALRGPAAAAPAVEPPGGAAQSRVEPPPRAPGSVPRSPPLADSRAGLGRVAGVLLLLAAGVAAGYWLFGSPEQVPVQAAVVPAVPPAALPPVPSDVQVPASGEAPAAVPAEVEPAPLAESLAEPQAAARSPEPETVPEAAVEAEAAAAAVPEAVPQAVAPPPVEAAPRPVARPVPAPRPAPAPVVSPPAPPPAAAEPPAVAEPVAPASQPVPEPVLAAEPVAPPAAQVAEERSAAAAAEAASAPPAAPVRSEPQPFTTDPCRGPAARYLSTCR